MRLGALEAIAAEFDGPEFDDHAALPESGITVARRQDTTDPGAAADAAAGKRRLTGVPRSTATRTIGGGDHPREELAGKRLPPLVAEPTPPRFTIIDGGPYRYLPWCAEKRSVGKEGDSRYR